MTEILHPIPPVWDENSRILILGSFPSVKSRETCFFYGHPQNRFWRVLAAVTKDECPKTIPEKKAFLLSHGIALWDVLASCEITGSADSAIRNASPNDLTEILGTADIRAVFVNGRTAEAYYRRFSEKETGRQAIPLPSTSPANAAWTLDKLIAAWSCIGEYL